MVPLARYWRWGSFPFSVFRFPESRGGRKGAEGSRSEIAPDLSRVREGVGNLFFIGKGLAVWAKFVNFAV